MDVHVGKHIFKHVYMGLLKRKTRLVTMHQLQYLKHADVVYCMGASAQRTGLKCTVAASGTLKQLMVRACSGVRSGVCCCCFRCCCCC